MSDNLSLEQLFNDFLSKANGVYRDLRVTHPLNEFEGYQVVNQDLNPGSTSYYGYLNADGAYIIMKGVESGTVTTFTFITGTSGYSTAWTGRAGLSYLTYDNAF